MVHIFSTDGQRHHTWVLEKPLLSISERLHHASPPFWSDHGSAWVVLAFRHKGEEPTSELFAVTGRRDEHRPQLFRYTFRLSEGARSRTATVIPFPSVGLFSELAYSPVSKRLAVFGAGELSCPLTEPFPRQLQWLPGGRKLCFEFRGAFYVVDAV